METKPRVATDQAPPAAAKAKGAAAGRAGRATASAELVAGTGDEDIVGQDFTTKKAGQLVRVSITFKVACGAAGTKSRDFPGRHFCPRDRDILQDWAGQFRRGISLALDEPDLRTIRLPDAHSSAKRRKPFIGITEVSRTDAYHW